MVLEQAVGAINSRMEQSLNSSPCLEGAQLFGLAEPILRRNEEGEEVFPAIIHPNGEDTYIQLDDDYPIGLYHRLISRTYQSKKGYGDALSYYAVDEILAICWGFRKYVDPYKLEHLLFSALPDEAKRVVSNFDRFSVFNGEFSGVPFFFPESCFLFSHRYRIQYEVSAGCINTEENICNS